MSENNRLEELIEEARRLSDGTMILGGIEKLPRAVAERFLERVIAGEIADRAGRDGAEVADRLRRRLEEDR